MGMHCGVQISESRDTEAIGALGTGSPQGSLLPWGGNVEEARPSAARSAGISTCDVYGVLGSKGCKSSGGEAFWVTPTLLFLVE